MVFVWQGVKRRFPECNAILLVVLVLVVQGISTSVDVISHSGRRLGHADAAAASKRELIAGGVAADPERYPFFALTANDAYDSTRDNVCGAVLIHPDILLTAAHCHGFFNYGVRMYDSRSQKYDQRRRIVEQWRHPNFNLNNDNLNWDVMVMRLEEPVYDIAPVPLNSNANVPARNEILLSAGFGATTYLGDLTNILMEGEFQYMMPDVCANRISTFKITGATNGNELLCTGSTSAENSICLGDSGGPLLTQDGVLVGIASWTVRCESDQIPDGFARVSTMYNWIEERICEISAEKPLTCPESPTIPTNEMVEMWLQFRYDFSPEDTTFAVRNRQTRSIEYAGPTYVVPDRVIDSAWISNFFLPEGGYAFEVYDKQDNGLSETDLGAQRGFWELYARHQDGTKDFSLVASGGHSFTESSTTNFQIVAAPTQSPTTSPTFSPTLSPTKSPTFSPTWSPTLSIAPSGIPATQAPSSVPTATPTGMPSLSPTNTPTTATPTGMPSLFPTNTPRPINRPTVSPFPSTMPSDEPSFVPTISAEPSTDPTFTPTFLPTISPAPTSAPSESFTPTVDDTPPIAKSTGAFELAATLLLALFFLTSIALVRSKFFVDNPQWWSSFARAFARTPWPTAGNMAIFATFVDRIYGWTRGAYDQATASSAPSLARAGSEQVTEASDGTSVSGISSRLVVRFYETRSKIRTWCVTTWDQAMSASIQDYPSDVVQMYLSSWYQEVFPVQPSPSDESPPRSS